MSIDNRATVLRGADERLTGIDFVQVIRPDPEPNEGGECDPFQLKIYFHTDVRNIDPAFYDPGTDPDPLVPLTLASIVIHDANGDPLVPNVPLVPDSELVWDFDANACRSVLTISVQSPGDFRNYRLRIDDPIVFEDLPSRIDPFFNDVLFTFEIGCEDNLDCKAPPLFCPEERFIDFPVDYLARDFVSLRNALLDFAGQRYPQWTLPIEADVGSMLMEIFAALGDELSYVQDRHAREAFLETATERRTLRKKARLLDYDIHDGRSATALLEFRIASVDGFAVETGTPVYATNEGGPAVRFEVGIGLRDPNEGYPLREGWNAEELVPYWFDGSKKCLEVGATELFITGEVEDFELIDAGTENGDHLMLLRSEDPDNPAVPRRRHFVHVTEILPTEDPLTNETVTRIRWDASDALPFQIDQELLRVSLNIVPATAGERRCIDFVCGADGATNPPPDAAVEREGSLPLQTDLNVDPERPTIFLFSLPDSDTGGIGFLGPSLRETLPEVLVEDLESNEEWEFSRSLLEATLDQKAFTLEDGTWRRVVLYRNGVEEIIHKDYASNEGYTLRFGDGMFGRQPARGTVFRVRYRLGPGSLANVAPDTITKFNLPSTSTICEGDDDEPSMPNDPTGDRVLSVTNPWPVLDGADPESAADIKLLTPEAYRADRFFALQAADYGEQAQKLPFVQRANGKFRWTGSWNTVFVAADPLGSFTLSDDQFAELEEWMDCVRQAGRDVIVKDPKFRTLDLEITICVQPFAYPGQVVQAVFEALMGRRGPRPKKGFFDPDNFTFGVPFRRSALEAAIQDVPGVRSVQQIRKRERGRLGFALMTEFSVEVAPDEVFRLENDPVHPERGSLRIRTTGGS
jgi:hypothetical protein